MTHDETQFPLTPPPDQDGALSPDLEAQGVDELSAETFRAFIATGRLHARLITRLVDADEGDARVHPGQFFCLRAVSAHDGISQRELADELHVAPPSVSRMLQNMERAGLVERRDDEHDQRVTRVYVTDRGREFEARFRAVAAGYVKDTIGRLPETDRRELIRLLKAFGETIKAAIDARSGASDGPAPASQGSGDASGRDGHDGVAS
ncbi:MAG TPA: MarR family winged helix-turn-helix transcriptional regulator [Thermoleophilia bacterium]|nr:MarR family winged helix-turn-helix transcriptional regulator [Thermoleophilia bacterium]